MYDYQGMIVLATNQIWWTWEVEDVFKKVQKGNKMAMKNYAKQQIQQIEDVVVGVSSFLFCIPKQKRNK
jgi:dynein heavy chain, axonemal